MNHTTGYGEMRRTFCWVAGFLALLLVLTGLSQAAKAQTLVVANFSGKIKALKGKAQTTLTQALKKKGAKLIPFNQYLSMAKKSRIRPNRALMPLSIRALAKKMNLDGIVTGNVGKMKNRFLVRIQVFGANGKILVKKAYGLKRPNLPSATAEQLAGLIREKLGVGTVVAEAAPLARTEPPPPPPAEMSTEAPPSEPPPEFPPPPPESEPPPDTKTAKAGSTSDAFLPPWARTDQKKEATTTALAETTTAPSPPEVSTAVYKKKREKLPGAVPDILVAAGVGLNTRAGLNPRHESGLFPALRVDGWFFLESFLDVPVVKDIGFGGMYNMSLALKYKTLDRAVEWNSSHSQWAGEFVYRLAFNRVALAPAFLFRFGYGSTAHTIDTNDPAAKSAGYSYPYGALDIYLMLFKPLLRFYVSAGYLFSVGGSEDLEGGSGSGFSARAGLALDLFENLHLSLGYDLVQFLIEDGGAKTSDTYQAFFARIGWNYQ